MAKPHNKDDQEGPAVLSPDSLGYLLAFFETEGKLKENLRNQVCPTELHRNPFTQTNLASRTTSFTDDPETRHRTAVQQRSRERVHC